MDKTDIQLATSTLKAGGVIAYPSEGVWGLGCDPFNEAAVQCVLDLKKRSADKGLILIASSCTQLSPILAGLEHKDEAFLRKIWPGPDTWLLPDSNQLIPSWIKGKFATVAIRITRHPIAAAICESFDGLIVSTSANPESLTPATSKAQINEYFPVGIGHVVAGELGGQSGPSVINDLATRKILRG